MHGVWLPRPHPYRPGLLGILGSLTPHLEGEVGIKHQLSLMPHDPTIVDDLAWPGPAATWHLEQAVSRRDEAAVACKGEAGELGTKHLGWEPAEPGIPAQLPTAAQS